MAPSKEVNEVVGAAPERDLAARRAELQRIAATKTPQQQAVDELVVVEQQMATQAAADLLEDVKKRMLGIARASGSLAVALDQDDERLLETARAYAQALDTLNTRFDKLALLRHEAQALHEVFAISVPDLPRIVVPTMRRAVGEAASVVASVSVRDHGHIAAQRGYDPVRGVFTERTFSELADTDGYVLIQRRLAQTEAARG